MRQTRKEISIKVSLESMKRACEICDILTSVETGARKIVDLDPKERALYDEHLPTWTSVYAKMRPLIEAVRESTRLSGRDYNIIVYCSN